MCFSKPQAPPPAQLPEPPPAPATVKVGAEDEGVNTAMLKARKLGKKALQVPLGGTDATGLGIPV